MSFIARAYGLHFLAIIALIAAGVFVLDVSFPLGIAACVPYIALVLTGLWHPRRNFVFVLAATGSVLTVLGYFFSAPYEIDWMVLTDRGQTILVIWITAALCYRRKGWEAELEARIQRRTMELSKEIDKRKSMEIIIHRNEVMASFPEENPSPLLMFTQDGRLSYANKASAPLLDYFKFGIDQPAPEEWRLIFAELLKSARTSETPEVYMECVCGESAFSLLFMKMRLSFIHMRSPYGIKVYGRSITKRKHAEAAMLAAKEQYQDLYENAPSAYCSISYENGLIVRHNAAFIHLFGYEHDELANMTLFDLYAHPLDDNLKDEELSTLPNEERETGWIERQMRRKNGEIIWVSLSGKPAKIADGETAKFRLIITNITELVQTRHDLIEQKLHLSNYAEELKANTQSLEASFEELKIQRDKAEAAGLAKSQFLNTMSHELRTPLNAVMGFSAIMIKQTFGPLGSPLYAEYAKDIYQSGSDLLSMIENILEMSKIDATECRIHREAFILADLTSEVFASVKGRADENKISLINEISPELPLLFADKKAIRQILINLIVNAIKFSHEGGAVVVAAKALTPHFNITVTDTGVGISGENISTAMEPFSQIERSNHKKQEGMGLGLPLCKALTELHGGELRIDSELGKGTKVTVTLPVSTQITWSPSMSVGIAVLDSDHKILLAVIDRLVASSWVGDGHKVVKDAIEALSVFGEIHLGIEEVLMDALEYPDAEEHKAEHEKFRSWVSDLKKNYGERKNPHEIAEIGDYLGKWFIHHILTVDKAYSEFFDHKAEDVSTRLADYIGVMRTLNYTGAKKALEDRQCPM